MNITSDVKDAKLTATVTIPAADVDAIIKKAYKAAAKQYRFPGFRAGKAPRPVIDSALGEDAVLAQATNELIGSNEGNVLNELDIVPVKEGDYQEIDLCADGTDYTYTVEFTLRPFAELSSYDAVEIEMPPAEVTEAEIDQQVDMLMGYHATFEDVERAVEGSDYVTVDIKNVANAEALAGEGRVIAMGAGHLPKEFDEGLLGMNVDETKTISWTPEVEGAEEASV
ncbi:trigger factor, partial [Collinsella stercoris]|uniref:trigger factor n=1 Tax=Collinsella stercoris TaxID=147206 RepID=UPI003AF114B4